MLNVNIYVIDDYKVEIICVKAAYEIFHEFSPKTL